MLRSPTRRLLPLAASLAALMGVVPVGARAEPPSALPSPPPPGIVPCSEERILPQLRRELSLSCLAAPAPAGEATEDAPAGIWTEAQRTHPIRRNSAALVHDESRGVILLFGGYACSGAACNGLNDTWSWNGERWERLSPATSPGPRYATGAAYDAEREEVVIFGGSTCDLICKPGDETWTWNGSTWTRESPEHSPPPLFAPAMTYDRGNKEVVLYGGCATAVCPSPTATWTWDGTDWTAHVEPHLGVSGPTPRHGSGMAYDEAGQRTILYGGSDLLGNATGDTWSWNGSAWTELHPETSPGPRLAPAMTYETAHQRVVLYGGSARTCTGTCVDSYKNETWTFEGNEWKHVSTAASPPPSSFGALAVDPSSGDLMLAGGQGLTNPNLPVVANVRSTWAFDGETWEERRSTVPEERKDPSLVYDPVSGLTLMIGGTCIYDETCGVWAWDGTAWSHLSSGPQGWYTPAAYHPSTRKVVLYGGPSTWIWDGACRSWKKVTPPTSPSPRYGWAAATDRNGNVVLFGGTTGTDYLADTWVWDGATWNRDLSSVQPSSRGFATAAYDPLRGETVLFGGLTDGGDTYYDDTWVWDGSGWTQRTPSTKPATRAWSAMASDPGSSSLVLVGGIGGPNLTVLNDAWSWDGTNWSQTSGAPVPRFGTGMAEHPPSGSLVLFGGQDANPGRVMSDTRVWRSQDSQGTEVVPPPCG